MSVIARWCAVCALAVLGVSVGYWGVPALPVNLARSADPAPPPRGAAAVPKSVNPLSGKVLAGAESSCTSAGLRTPIDLRGVQVRVGEVAGHAGTTAQVTMAYSGVVPATGEVLWTLLATNPAGSTIQLDARTLNGQRASYGLGASAENSAPGQIGMVLPSAGLEMLGSVWWWSAMITIDGRVIDTCPDTW